MRHEGIAREAMQAMDEMLGELQNSGVLEHVGLQRVAYYRRPAVV